VVSEALETSGYALVGLLNDWEPDGPVGFDVPMIVGETAIAEWLAATDRPRTSFSISIGNQHGRARWQRHRLLTESGLKAARVQHPTAFVSPSARVGDSAQLLAFAFVGAGAVLGDAVLLNTRASVDHECRLGHGVHIGPGATLAGRVDISDFTFVGAGATVMPDVSIGADILIGAGAVVTRSIEEAGVYAGVPARKLG